MSNVSRRTPAPSFRLIDYDSKKPVWMTKRLQAILENSEYREIQAMARARHMTIAEWVRQAVRADRSPEPLGAACKKLDAIRLAANYEFPTADIDAMNTEIERSYLD